MLFRSEMGIDWWKNADYLSQAQESRVDAPEGDQADALDAVNERLARLEDRLEALADDPDNPGASQSGDES